MKRRFPLFFYEKTKQAPKKIIVILNIQLHILFKKNGPLQDVL